MSETSARLGLPLIQAGQAQKELFHNEALLRLDALVHGAVQEAPRNDPPGAPTAGQAWIVGAAPGGDWTGQAGALAAWTGGGWRFVAPREGMLIWIVSEGTWLLRTPAGWQTGVLPVRGIMIAGHRVVGPQQPAIAAPAGGATVDAEARTAVLAMIETLRNHGLIAT